MADVCAEFKSLDAYDSWIVPHQALPCIAIIMGIEWKEVFLIMYAWETLEVIGLNCIGIAEAELTSNALISDPFQCLMGVLVGELFIRAFNNGQVVKESTSHAYLWSILFIIAGVPVIIGGYYVWGYLPLYLIFSFVAMSDKRALLVATCAYVTVLVTVVYATKDHFNSFYAGLIVGLITSLMTLVKLLN